MCHLYFVRWEHDSQLYAKLTFSFGDLGTFALELAKWVKTNVGLVLCFGNTKRFLVLKEIHFDFKDGF
jgi:hypothetical protein